MFFSAPAKIRFFFFISVISGGLLFSAESLAQQRLKQEVEKRIKAAEMPKQAIRLLTDWLRESRKVRFYYETDGEQQSYEAKLTRHGRIFSIEFDEEGSLLDVEELVSYSYLPSSVKESINKTLRQNYERYKIRRVQQQFLPQTTEEDLLDSLAHSSEIDGVDNIHYELEVDVKEESQARSYELLFDAQGQMVQRRLIVRRSLDNFLY